MFVFPVVLVYICIVKPIRKCIKNYVLIFNDGNIIYFMELPMLCGSKVIHVKILIVLLLLFIDKQDNALKA